MRLDLVPQDMLEAEAGKNCAHLAVEVTDLDGSLERVVAIGGSLVKCIKNTNGEPRSFAPTRTQRVLSPGFLTRAMA
jgi:predicted enzyme related to lactoylglutathione lyase